MRLHLYIGAEDERNITTDNIVSFSQNIIKTTAAIVMSSRKTLVVFGATGQQGGSVIDVVINDPELSQMYNVRAVTRDPSKPAAQALQQKNVEVVAGDADDEKSLHQALQGAHTVFAITVTVYDDKLKEREVSQGKAIANAAVAAGAQFLVFSTLSHVGNTSGGKYQRVTSFDGKAEVESYIRTLPIKSAFFAPGSFMQNHMAGGILAPHPTGDGTYAISSIISPRSQFPLIEIAGDTGKYVGAILAEPEKYEGRVFCAATAIYTLEDIAATISKVTGKTVKYVQVPEDVLRKFVPPPGDDIIIEMLLYVQDFGYYGPQTQELTKWAADNALGKLTTLEDFIRKNPPV